MEGLREFHKQNMNDIMKAHMMGWTNFSSYRVLKSKATLQMGHDNFKAFNAGIGSKAYELDTKI